MMLTCPGLILLLAIRLHTISFVSLLTLKLGYISLYNHQSNVHEVFSLKTVFMNVLLFCMFIYGSVLCCGCLRYPCLSVATRGVKLSGSDGLAVSTGNAKESQFALALMEVVLLCVSKVLLMHYRFLSFHTSL